jgi:pimeloyl-ACP methyl ester carboxylesterase
MIALLVSSLILAALALIASWYLFPEAWAAGMLRSARRAAGVRLEQKVIGGIEWRWLEGGKGPALVMLHGFAAAGDHWLGVAGHLRGRFRLLIPDLPGFGLSQGPDNLPFDIPSQADRVWAWLDSLGVQECIIAGSSMGGWIAAQCAASRPDRVPALWLLDPLGVNSARISEIMARIERGERNPFSIKTTADVHSLARDMLHRAPPSIYPLLRSEARRTSRLRPQLDRMQQEIMHESVPIEDLAVRLVMPVLLQWGAKDRAVDVSGAAILEQCLPDIEVNVQENVGHLPMLETPLRSARMFTDFCRRHPIITGRNGESHTTQEA